MSCWKFLVEEEEVEDTKLSWLVHVHALHVKLHHHNMEPTVYLVIIIILIINLINRLKI